jgi:hypothetical protein
MHLYFETPWNSALATEGKVAIWLESFAKLITPTTSSSSAQIAGGKKQKAKFRGPHFS